MHPSHLHLLVCPKTDEPLTLHEEQLEGGRIRSGQLISQAGESYPIVDFIPRFVSSDNYAANFGLEWQIHARTQYDVDAGHKMSEDRVFSVTGWERDLSGRLLLEAGSGSGRFTEHLVKTGATVVSFDFSQAVESNYQSNGGNENLLLIQADMYKIPLRKASFDNVFCFGVLQHTPDPNASFRSLVAMVRPGGKIATDIYLKTLMRYYLNTRYWVRPLTRQMDPQKLYKWCKGYVSFMWPLARLIRRIPVIGEAINWRLLIADYYQQMPDADDETLREWAYLDTFDMLSPRYDTPQTISTFTNWHHDAGLTAMDVRRGPNGIVGTATRPEAAD